MSKSRRLLTTDLDRTDWEMLANAAQSNRYCQRVILERHPDTFANRSQIAEWRRVARGY